MSARVYLMVDRCDGPRSFGRVRTVEPGDLMSDGDINDDDEPVFEPTRRQDEARTNAPRWWLVEAESADAARRVIRCNGMTACDGSGPTGCDGDSCPFGRILDSGGAR